MHHGAVRILEYRDVDPISVYRSYALVPDEFVVDTTPSTRKRQVRLGTECRTDLPGDPISLFRLQ